MAQPLYLTYRSSSFDTLVGQKHIATILQHQVATGQSAHTYIFFGPRGVGKTSTARIFAKALNCTNTTDGNPCGECANCKLIASGASIDITEIDAASYTGVDTIREVIIDKVAYPPTQLTKKVYIIDEAHMLSKSAFNALLKVMEEAPEYAVFILATTEIHKVPETIISRAQMFQFKPHTVSDITDHLRYIASQEGITADDDALIAIARLADGGLRDAVKYFDQTRIGGDVTLDRVSQFLGVIPQQRLGELIDLLVQRASRAQISAQLDQFATDGVDRSRLTADLLVALDERFGADPATYHPLITIVMQIADEIRYSQFAHLLYRQHLYPLAADAASIDLTVLSSSPSTSSPASAHTVPTSPRPKETPPHKKTPESKETEKIKKTAVSPPASGSAILDYLRTQSFGKTIDSALTKSTSFVDQHDDTYRYVVINSLHHKALTKSLDTILSSLRDSCGEATTIAFVYQSKEDFVAGKPLA